MTRVIPPYVNDPKSWAENIRRYLARTLDQLGPRDANASASENGVLLWDRDNKYPVVSLDGEWRQLVIANGFAVLNQDVDVTAPAIDTAYKVPFDLVVADGITLTGAPLTEITFAEGGLYLLAFTAQCSSTSSSTVNFRFWPRINGTDATGSTIVASLHSNGATMVASRSAIFSVGAGEVLNVMFAVDSLSGRLKAHPATAYAPAAPSATLSITRIKA